MRQSKAVEPFAKNAVTFPMSARQLLFAGLIVVLLFLPLSATTVDAPEIDSLITQADYVVRAVVISAKAEWREIDGRRYIGTRVELEIREAIKGSPPSPLVLELIGGRVGEDELVIEGLPRFYVGDENVLFVHGEQRKMFPLVALMHGVYPVIREARTGQEYMLRSNGLPLYSATDVSLPMNQVSPARLQNPQARPLTATAFIRQIRERAAVIQPSAREK
jgi:hypothetical protein